MMSDGSLQRRLTDSAPNDSRPVWSPDGREIVFDSSPGIWVLSVRDLGVRMLTDNSDADATWSPDGSKIAFARCCPGGATEIFVMEADGSNVVRLTRNADGSQQTNLSNDPGTDLFPNWKP
jgi:Tol biopolymer transport system component